MTAPRSATPKIPGSGVATPSTRRSRAGAWARTNWLLVAAIAGGLAARIVVWTVTDRRLDDALITIKFAKNVAEGHGLVHNLGDGHVYGFTSALSVLIPLPGELIAPGGGIFLLRLVSLVAFAVAAVYAYRISCELGIGPWPTGFALAFLAFDQNQVMFGMAGMETQVAVAVLLAGVFYVLAEDYIKSGVSLGLALLARPDFVLWVGPAYLFLFVRHRARALRAGLISGAIVAPWLIFTTAYYGTPIPNTVTAKNLVSGPVLPSLADPGAWIDFLGDQFGAHAHDWPVLAPFLEHGFVLHAPLPRELLEATALLVVALGVIGAVGAWNRPGLRPAIAFVALFALYKVIFLTYGYFEWYGVPAFAVLILLAAVGLDRASAFIATTLQGRIAVPRAQLAALPATLLALAYAIQLPYVVPLEARIQHDIENHVRVPLGRYLGRVVRPGQTFTSESSGYVGYYTNATLYDYPGLVSTTVVDALRDAGISEVSAGAIGGPAFQGLDSPAGVAKLLRPDWLVLRPDELELFRDNYPRAARLYRPVRQFGSADAHDRLELGGLRLYDIDREFIVLRRRALTPQGRGNGFSQGPRLNAPAG